MAATMTASTSSAAPQQAPFVVRKDLARSYLFIAVGAVLALGSLAVLVTSLRDYSAAPWLVWGSSTGLAAGTACALLFLRFLPEEKVALTIDATGITDHSFGLACGFIPWDEIRGVYKYRVRGGLFMVVELRDPETFARSRRPDARKFMEARLEQGLPLIEIRTHALKGNYSVDEVLDEVRRFRPKLVKKPRRFKGMKG